MRKQRRCGCDCRDTPCEGEFDPPDCGTFKSPVMCEEFADGEAPCSFIVRFGCHIRDADGNSIARANEIIKPACRISNCEWVSLGFDRYEDFGDSIFDKPLNGQLCSDLSLMLPRFDWSHCPYPNEPDCSGAVSGMGRVWDSTYFSIWTAPCSVYSVTPDDAGIPTDIFGVKWTLTPSNGGATFTSDSGEYSTSSFDIYSSNTLTKVSGDDNLPQTICISPWFDRYRDIYACNENATPGMPYTSDEKCREGAFKCDADEERKWALTECDCKVPCEYTDERERETCCDECCDGLPVSVVLTCAGTRYSYSGLAEPGGRTGVNSPAGVSREFCFTHDGHEICLVFYCDGSAWQLDSYCDGSYEGPGTVSDHTCCPLRFSFTFQLSCVYCSGCGCAGDTSTCPECEEPDCCCPTYIVPTSLTATLYDSSNVQLCSYPIIKVGDTWSGSATCGSYTVETQMRCQDFGGGSCAYVVSIDCGSGGLSLTQLNQVCEPFYWESTAIGSGFCGVDKVIITE